MKRSRFESKRPSVFRCVTCDATRPLTDIVYRCDCGGLLEVEHPLADFEASPAEWKDLFESRWGERSGAFASGVWRYAELLLPALPPGGIVSLPEGSTRLFRSSILERELDLGTLFLKHEGENPTLSFKDRGMTAGVSWARHLGREAVVCASTGDTSASMAAYAAAAGMKALVLLPENRISGEQLAQPLASGAKTLALQTDFDGCMKLVAALAAARPVYLLNSMNSIRIEGQKTIAWETIQQLGWRVPDWIVVPVGNAGNISALGKALEEWRSLGLLGPEGRLPRLAGVQAVQANPFARSFRGGFARKETVTAGRTVASAIAIGDPVSFDKARRAVLSTGGVVTDATEEEILDAKALVDAAGISVCPNSATAVAGLRKLRADGTVRREELVVVIATAHGVKFSSTTLAYHEGRIEGVRSLRANRPVSLPPTLEAILGAMEE
jgi:threonine synthase